MADTPPSDFAIPLAAQATQSSVAVSTTSSLPDVYVSGAKVDAAPRSKSDHAASTGLTVAGTDDSANDKTTVTYTNSMATVATTAGDLLVATAAGAYKRLALGTANQELLVNSAGTDVSWASRQIAYVEFTASVTVALSTTEASPTDIVSAGAISFDGVTPVIIEFYAPSWTGPGAGAGNNGLNLWDSTDQGRVWFATNEQNAAATHPAILVRRRVTPSNASHTFKIRGWDTNSGTAFVVQAGAGGAGTLMPGYIRIERA